MIWWLIAGWWLAVAIGYACVIWRDHHERHLAVLAQAEIMQARQRRFLRDLYVPQTLADREVIDAILRESGTDRTADGEELFV